MQTEAHMPDITQHGRQQALKQLTSTNLQDIQLSSEQQAYKLNLI